MKKYLFLVGIVLFSLLFSANAYGDRSVGTMWQQDRHTVTPADDVVYVDFTGYTTVGITGGGGGGGNSFTNISVSDEAYLNEISGYDMMLQGVFGSGTSLDVAGSGTRCFFYPKNAAWRCGFVTSDNWNEANIGDYSFASGYNTLAQGWGSTAEGHTTSASNTGAHAEGITSIASGVYSHAEGDTGHASGDSSHAEGKDTFATGRAAHSEGQGTRAEGIAAHAQGRNTVASGTDSSAGGSSTLAAGTASFAIGKSTITKAARSFVSGMFLNISSSALNSVMFGNYTNATVRDANILATPNTFKLANMDLIVDGDLTVTGASTVKAHSGYLAYKNITGVFEAYTTADIFYKVQTFNNASSFGNVSSSLSDYSLNIRTGGAGLYEISRDTSFHGEQGISYSLAIFKNGTAIDESHTSASIGIEATPFFANLSSFDDATFDTNSSLSFLRHNDKDQIKIVESGSGNGANEWCFEYETHFAIHHIPHLFKLGNTQYNGGSGHFADALAFDNWSSEWDNLRVATSDIVNAGAQADYKNENIEFEFPNGGNEARYILNGIVKTKIRHNDSTVCSDGHEIWVDKLSVVDKLGPRSDSSSIQAVLAEGDKITVQEKPHTDNKFFHRHKTQLNITRIGD